MNEKIDSFEGVVIQIGQYGENGSVITFLSENGLSTAYARNINKTNSKLRNALGLLNIVRVEIKTTKTFKYPILTLAEPIFILKDRSLDKESFKFFLSDSYLKLFLYDKFKYEEFKTIVKSIEKTNLTLPLGLFYITKAYKYLGIKLSFDNCYNCSNADIDDFVSFNIDAGGVICKNCVYKFNTKRINKRYFSVIPLVENNLSLLVDKSKEYLTEERYLFIYLTKSLFERFDIEIQDSLNFYLDTLKL